jgi:Predicted transcriptional regulators
VSLGEYIKELRNDKGLSQRDLADKAGISNGEISRIESGERKNPSPNVLMALATILGVTDEEIMKEAGYIRDVIEHEGYIEDIYRDEDGKLIDITRRAKDMYQKDSKWANLAYRVSSSDLSKEELDIIKANTSLLLEQVLKKIKKK